MMSIKLVLILEIEGRVYDKVVISCNIVVAHIELQVKLSIESDRNV